MDNINKRLRNKKIYKSHKQIQNMKKYLLCKKRRFNKYSINRFKNDRKYIRREK